MSIKENESKILYLSFLISRSKFHLIHAFFFFLHHQSSFLRFKQSKSFSYETCENHESKTDEKNEKFVLIENHLENILSLQANTWKI